MLELSIANAGCLGTEILLLKDSICNKFSMAAASIQLLVIMMSSVPGGYWSADAGWYIQWKRVQAPRDLL